MRIEDLELNRMERTVKRAGGTIDLTAKEFTLAEYLMRNAGQNLARAKIIRHVWSLSLDTQNVIQFHHTPELAPPPNGLVALVNLADLLCRLRGMGYCYEELREIDFQDAPAWALLQKAAPHLETFRYGPIYDGTRRRGRGNPQTDRCRFPELTPPGNASSFQRGEIVAG